MKVQRFTALLLVLLFGVISIGGDGCFTDSTNPNASLDCCPADQIHYQCSVTAQVTEIMKSGDGTGTSVRCFSAIPPCAGSFQDAQTKAIAQAQLYYSAGMTNTVGMQTVSCLPMAACVTATAPQDYRTLDTPGACGEVIMPADAGASCTSNTEACTTDTECCSGVCSESDVCEACRASLEGCVVDSECCSASAR